MMPSNIPPKLKYYPKIPHNKLQVAYLKIFDIPNVNKDVLEVQNFRSSWPFGVGPENLGLVRRNFH